MKTQIAPRMAYSFRLTKWEGDPPKEEPANPEKHPDCVEIREWQMGQPNKIIYKRDNGE